MLEGMPPHNRMCSAWLTVCLKAGFSAEDLLTVFLLLWRDPSLPTHSHLSRAELRTHSRRGLNSPGKTGGSLAGKVTGPGGLARKCSPTPLLLLRSEGSSQSVPKPGRSAMCPSVCSLHLLQARLVSTSSSSRQCVWNRWHQEDGRSATRDTADLPRWVQCSSFSIRKYIGSPHNCFTFYFDEFKYRNTVKKKIGLSRDNCRDVFYKYQLQNCIMILNNGVLWNKAFSKLNNIIWFKWK